MNIILENLTILKTLNLTLFLNDVENNFPYFYISDFSNSYCKLIINKNCNNVYKLTYKCLKDDKIFSKSYNETLNILEKYYYLDINISCR